MEYLQLMVYFLVLFTISYGVYTIYLQKNSNATISKNKKCLSILFIGYVCALVSLTIVPSERFSLNKTITLTNYLPVINTYKRYAMVTYFENQLGIKMFWQNFIGNILLFIPLGSFLLLLYRKRLRTVIAMAFIASSFIELTQLFFSLFGYYRFIDIDDVLLNTFGACVGYVAAVFYLRYAKSKKSLSLIALRY
jgi:glycopeptide antibiotics resistance protein